MKRLLYYLAFIIISHFWIGCNNNVKFLKSEYKVDTVLYVDDLIITQIAPHTYIHTSYLQTKNFGNVSCNGMVVIQDRNAYIFDTPTSDSTSNKLLNWVEGVALANIVTVIPTHYHNDCLDGLEAFHRRGIASSANPRTIGYASDNNFKIPQQALDLPEYFLLATDTIYVNYFGPGHTQDNIVAYYSKDKTLFGGCLIKEINASRGNLADADTLQWANTVIKLKDAFPNIKLVIPGHGQYGDTALLNYTIELFK
jgi:metallo-beta-lactamase class B